MEPKAMGFEMKVKTICRPVIYPRKQYVALCYLSSTARVCNTLELGGTLWVSQMLPPITEP